MGCATAYHLAKRGRRVLLLEQFAIGHERGSSHGHSRIFRLAYLPDYVRLAQRGVPALARAGKESARICCSRPADSISPTPAATIEIPAPPLATGVPFELLDHAALQRLPQFAVPSASIGIYQADTGILDATKCVLTLASEGPLARGDHRLM